MAMGAASAKGEVAANINVTPMIDVMLVLLIIFMIVTPAITAGFQATIPRAKNPDAREEQEGEIRLGIDRDGKFYLDLTDPRSGKYTGPRYISDADLQGSSRRSTPIARSTRSCISRRTRASSTV